MDKKRETIGYKKWLEGLKETPPDSVWENISNELDIDDVWTRIAPQLPTEKPDTLSAPSRNWNYGRWAVGLLLLLTLTTPIPEKREVGKASIAEITPQDEGNKTPDEKAQDELVVVPESRKPESTRNNDQASDLHTFADPLRNSKSARGEDATINNESNLLSSPPLDHTVSSSLSADIANQFLHIEVTMPDFIFPEKETEVKSTDDSEDKKLKSRKIHFAVGMVSSLNNTWLLNNETYEGWKSNSLVNTLATYGREYGGMVNLSNNEKSSLQVEFYIYSEYGQRYQEYINAFYQKKSVNLDYYKLQTLYRRRLTGNHGFISLYGLGGIFVSKLNKGELSIGNQNNDVTASYTPWDYGVTIGLETEIPINRQFIFVPGFRALYSTHNVFNGNGAIPSDFQKTYNAAVGISFALKYKLH